MPLDIPAMPVSPQDAQAANRNHLLDFTIFSADTLVKEEKDGKKLTHRYFGLRNASSQEKLLVIDKTAATLKSIRINGRSLSPQEYEVVDDKLFIWRVPKGDFALDVVAELETAKLPKFSDLSAETFYHNEFGFSGSTRSVGKIEIPAMPRDPEDTSFYQSDYRPYPYDLRKTDMHISFDDPQTVDGKRTVVSSEIKFAPKSGDAGPLVLNKKNMDVHALAIDGRPLSPEEYVMTDTRIVIKNPPAGDFTLQTKVEIDPRNMKAQKKRHLEGIYEQDGVHISQCESLGFQRITPYPDRPDVHAPMTVTVEDYKTKPALLTNGELVATQDLGNGRHTATWNDPYVKPAYLFGIVAGDLVPVSEKYVSRSGKETDVQIYVAPGDEGQVRYGLKCLLKCFKWLEDLTGVEYEYNNFKVAATIAFVFGAMENTTVNIFNAKLLYGNKNTATNAALLRIDNVLAHERTHHIFGNFVTIRSFGDISAKEGLNSFIDQLYMEMTFSAAIMRIQAANKIRSEQFQLDASPDAHAPRPEKAESFTNLYDMTSYEKTAEIVRMMRTMLGDDMFFDGLRKYIHDNWGTAVTCWELIEAMESVSGRDFTQFKNWYTQKGTPEVSYEGSYDAEKQEYILKISQTNPAEEEGKFPRHFPVGIGLLAKDGSELISPTICEVRDNEQIFVFKGVCEEPAAVSFNRNFTAPVKVTTQPSDEQLILLMKHDTDAFSQFSAADEIYSRAIMKAVAAVQAGQEPQIDPAVIDAVRYNLSKEDGDLNVQAYTLHMPALGSLQQRMEVIDPEALQEGIDFVRSQIGQKLWHELAQKLGKMSVIPAGEEELSPAQVGRQAMINSTMSYLVASGEDVAVLIADDLYAHGNELKDMDLRMSAFMPMARQDSPLAKEHFDGLCRDFLGQFGEMPIVRLELLKAISAFPVHGTVEKMQDLMDNHPELLNPTVPNDIYNSLCVFATTNPNFHKADGSGYRFFADMIIRLNAENPGVVPRMAEDAFQQWRNYSSDRQAMMEAEMKRIVATLGKDISEDLAPRLRDYLAAPEKKPAAAATVMLKTDAPKPV